MLTKKTIPIQPEKKFAHLTKNQRPISPLLTLNILMRPQRHPFPQTRHTKRIRHTQQRQILTKRQILRVQKHHRLVRQRAEPRVYARDNFVDPTSSEFVGFGGLQRNLDEHDFALPGRIFFEEGFECDKFVADTL
jgi:hypothetical protein